MASSTLSQTLSEITTLKLEELSFQRDTYEDEKGQLLTSINDEPDECKKIRMVLDCIRALSITGNFDSQLIASLEKAEKFLEHARFDPSVSTKLHKDWYTRLVQELDVHSSKYQYASLYGQLINQWLTADVLETSSHDLLSFEIVSAGETNEERAAWEQNVFKPRETDSSAIRAHLTKLFNSSKAIQSAYTVLVYSTTAFEKEMAKTVHFDNTTLTWVIQGLLRSDLLTEKKRKVVKEFLENKVVFAELADVLNMKMKSLDNWRCDPKGTPVEQRRMLNGRSRFYHDEDLLQAMLLRYIGVKWSVHFKKNLISFRSSEGVWKSRAFVPESDRKRREYFLGLDGSPAAPSVESHRQSHYNNEIFLQQLQDKVDEIRGGYDDDVQEVFDTRKNVHGITQTLLHTLAAEITMQTRLGREGIVVRSDFKAWGPSLPHSTIFAVLEFFGVSNYWVNFFRRALEIPVKFVEDGPEAPIRIRKRGTPVSCPLSDVLGESVLFCLDFEFNQRTEGRILYRLHDDIWFWGPDESCATGWAVMTEFAQLMGLEFNEGKTGSVRVSGKQSPTPLPAYMPKGDVRWGFLKLDGASGRFLIDQWTIDTQIKELRRQLDGCKSVFHWIQVWNIYGVRFFTSNFGNPANSFGRAHVEMILETFSRTQKELFASTGGSVTSTVSNMIIDNFPVKDIPEGFLHFPVTLGGLDLKSPFVRLYLIGEKISKSPETMMSQFIHGETVAYKAAKSKFEGRLPQKGSNQSKSMDHSFGDTFMSFEEFTRYRDQTSSELYKAYREMIKEPDEEFVVQSPEIFGFLDRNRDNNTSSAQPALASRDGSRGTQHFSYEVPSATRHKRSTAGANGWDTGSGWGKGRKDAGNKWSAAKSFDAANSDSASEAGSVEATIDDTWAQLSSYQRWIVNFYGPEMMKRFGGLSVVEKGLLPMGMVTMVRESRFKWQD